MLSLACRTSHKSHHFLVDNYLWPTLQPPTLPFTHTCSLSLSLCLSVCLLSFSCVPRPGSTHTHELPMAIHAADKDDDPRDGRAGHEHSRVAELREQDRRSISRAPTHISGATSALHRPDRLCSQCMCTPFLFLSLIAFIIVYYNCSEFNSECRQN